MVEFERYLANGVAIKRYFRGATTSQMIHYVKPHLEDELPDRVILHIGTNNLTKKRNQTEAEIVKEISEIVRLCHKGGVNEVFVSSLARRPKFQNKIDNINTLLKTRADEMGEYVFIDNSNILQRHLWDDNLHHLGEGTIILANNFLRHVNKTPFFESIWD